MNTRSFKTWLAYENRGTGLRGFAKPGEDHVLAKNAGKSPMFEATALITVEEALDVLALAMSTTNALRNAVRELLIAHVECRDTDVLLTALRHEFPELARRHLDGAASV